MTNMNRIPNSRESRLLPIETVKPYARRARRHSNAKIGKLKKLLGQFGQVAPILVDGDNVIISGHALHTAMRELGAGEIAAISIVGRSEFEIRALRLALNRLPLEAAWDDDNLRAELQELVELSFDLDLTGFDPPEIDTLLDLGSAEEQHRRGRCRNPADRRGRHLREGRYMGVRPSPPRLRRRS